MQNKIIPHPKSAFSGYFIHTDEQDQRTQPSTQGELDSLSASRHHPRDCVLCAKLQHTYVHTYVGSVMNFSSLSQHIFPR
jgi:hypothetical protein